MADEPEYKTVGGYINTDPHYITPEEEAALSERPAMTKPNPTKEQLLPFVGEIVHYWNPAYPDDVNWGVGKGPYAAIVTKVYDPWVSLSVFTHGKTEVFHIGQVPRRGSKQDDGEYPSWDRPQ